MRGNAMRSKGQDQGPIIDDTDFWQPENPEHNWATVGVKKRSAARWVAFRVRVFRSIPTIALLCILIGFASGVYLVVRATFPSGEADAVEETKEEVKQSSIDILLDDDHEPTVVEGKGHSPPLAWPTEVSDEAREYTGLLLGTFEGGGEARLEKLIEIYTALTKGLISRYVVASGVDIEDVSIQQGYKGSVIHDAGRYVTQDIRIKASKDGHSLRKGLKWTEFKWVAPDRCRVKECGHCRGQTDYGKRGPGRIYAPKTLQEGDEVVIYQAIPVYLEIIGEELEDYTKLKEAVVASILVFRGNPLADEILSEEYGW